MQTEALRLNTDEEGYLIEPGDWTPDAALELAKREDIELTPEHWEALRFMREYYDEHQVAPDARFVIKHLNATNGADRNVLFR